MVITNYQKGRYFEYRIKDYLEKKGWFVVRSGGSKFPDLVAIKNREVCFFECKNYSKGNVSEDDLEELKKIKAMTGARFFLAKNVDRKIVFTEFL